MSPANSIPIITIRATQRKMISRAVVRKLGRDRRPAARGVSSGQPRVANGHSAELNQVSSTSVSCSQRAGSMPRSRAARAASSSDSATISSPAAQYQTGIRWPHQSWREMHQGRMFPHPVEVDPLVAVGDDPDLVALDDLDRRAPPARPSGRTTAARSAARSARRSAARTARSARRAPRPESAPARAARRRRPPRASLAVSPANALPGRLVHAPVLADHRRSPRARACARSRSRSGRGPGVILSAPVPNSGSTCSSAMIGRRRPTSGRMQCRPTRSR